MTEKNKSSSDVENYDINEAKELLLGAAEEIKERFSVAENNLTNYAKKNPVKVIGISLLAGALMAQFFRLRK